MKVATICNPTSPYNKKQVKIREYHPNEVVEVFVIEDEVLLFIPLDHISCSNKTFKPKSRKDFYEFIQNEKTSRTQIIDTIKVLLKDHTLKIVEPLTADSVIEMFSNHERLELVEKFRSLRDEGLIEFTLVNNSFVPKKKFNKSYKK